MRDRPFTSFERAHLPLAAALVLSVGVASAASVWPAAGRGAAQHRARPRERARFVLSGNLGGSLGIGSSGSQPLNLQISNRRGRRLIVNHVVVVVSSVKQPAGGAGVCPQSGSHSPNFAIANLPRGYQVTVPPHATRRLSGLGRHWEPTVTWINQPWAQNGCLGSTVTFSYSARGRYATRRARTGRHG